MSRILIADYFLDDETGATIWAPYGTDRQRLAASGVRPSEQQVARQFVERFARLVGGSKPRRIEHLIRYRAHRLAAGGICDVW